jgi:hypothetical protein
MPKRDRKSRENKDTSAAAAAVGDRVLVDWLVDEGFGLEDANAFGWTALMVAVDHRWARIACTLSIAAMKESVFVIQDDVRVAPGA